MLQSMSNSEIKGTRAGAAIAGSLLLLGMMAPATGLTLSVKQMKGGNDPNMADKMLAVQGMKCSNSNSGAFTDVSMHNCFSRCRNSDCAALIFDSTIDKCKIYKSCSYEPSDSTTAVMFIPNKSSESSDIQFPGAAVLYDVDTHTTCEQPNIGDFEDDTHLADCMGICSNVKPCKHVVFNDRGDPHAQKCKLFGDCTHKDTAAFLTLFTPAGDVKPPCDPPVIVVCKEGSTSKKCLEYCGPNLSAQKTPECGGVIYKCK